MKSPPYGDRRDKNHSRHEPLVLEDATNPASNRFVRTRRDRHQMIAVGSWRSSLERKVPPKRGQHLAASAMTGSGTGADPCEYPRCSSLNRNSSFLRAASVE